MARCKSQVARSSAPSAPGVSALMQVACCRLCQSEAVVPHIVREMMMGTREEFLYYECTECGCLSLAKVPENLGQYYPDNYYAFHTRPSSLLRRIRAAIHLSRFSFLVSWRKRPDLDVIRRVNLKKDMTLLDVGCGSGSLIAGLRELGYNARGVDPFLTADVEDRFGLRVERKSLADVTDTFDVILFRHSLEHMPIESLQLARERLKHNGTCVVSIPLLGWAWRTYGTDWAQLDAPRSRFVHSDKSFSMLAAKSGFRIDRTIYDSTEFQFWASDSYQRDVPLIEMPKPNRSQRKRMRKLAASFNLKHLGDSAQFYLRPIK